MVVFGMIDDIIISNVGLVIFGMKKSRCGARGAGAARQLDRT
jgi:Sec-independent protein translocase protein TatA